MYTELTDAERQLLLAARIKSFRFYMLKSLYEIYDLVDKKPTTIEAKNKIKEDMRYMKSMSDTELNLLLDGITAYYLNKKGATPL